VQPIHYLNLPALKSRDGGPLEILVLDVFVISGRGRVITGVLRSGDFRIGDSVEVTRPDGATRVAQVRGIEIICRRPPVASDHVVGVTLDDGAEPYAIAGAVIRSHT
jgi:translation elongation factor EF-Tu-like GTPase